MASSDPPIALRLALAGAANCCAATVTNPLDVIKIQLQVSQRSLRSGQPQHGPRTSIIGVSSALWQNEGVRGFYRGLLPSLMREASYSALRLGLYEPFRDIIMATSTATASDVPLAGKAPSSASLGPGAGGGQGSAQAIPPPSAGTHAVSIPYHVKLAAGAASGVVGSALANPTDLLKVRLQAVSLSSTTSSSGGDGGLVSTAQSIYRHEALSGPFGGIRAFWRGVGPSMLRAATLTASQVGSYDEIKGWVKGGGLETVGAQVGLGAWVGPLAVLRSDGLVLHAVCSTAAGLVASLATTPIDVVKTRLMAGSKSRLAASPGSPPPSALACVRGILTQEGPLALYKGFWPTWMRIGPHTVVTFVVFERLREAAGMRPV